LTLGGAIVLSGMLEAGALYGMSPAAHVAWPVPWLMGLGVVSGIAYSVLSINQISLRQRITPGHLLGRVTAARRFLIFSMAPVGAAAGGWLGTHAGLEATILAGAVYMWWSPIRDAR